MPAVKDNHEIELEIEVDENHVVVDEKKKKVDKPLWKKTIKKPGPKSDDNQITLDL